MRITCKYCGGQHPAWECKSPAKRSAAENATSPETAIAKRGATGVSVNAADGREGSTTTPAGRKDLPVDTNSEPLVLVRSDPLRSGAATRKAAVPAAPKPRFDKVAYQREYVRKWRRGEVGKKHAKP